MKRTLAAVIAAFGLIVFANTVHADFPNRTVTILVHASPGGGFDAIARALGRYMKPFIPKNVDIVVKNVVGAGGITGTVAMYRAKPDGYTIGHIYADGMLGTQMIRDNVGYDIDKFTWLAVVSSQEAEALLVRKQSPYRTVEDLQKAKRVTWGVEGIGIARWVHAFLAANELKIPFDVVAGYGGTGETLPGLASGRLRRVYAAHRPPLHAAVHPVGRNRAHRQPRRDPRQERPGYAHGHRAGLQEPDREGVSRHGRTSGAAQGPPPSSGRACC